MATGSGRPRAQPVVPPTGEVVIGVRGGALGSFPFGCVPCGSVPLGGVEPSGGVPCGGVPSGGIKPLGRVASGSSAPLGGVVPGAGFSNSAGPGGVVDGSPVRGRLAGGRTARNGRARRLTPARGRGHLPPAARLSVVPSATLRPAETKSAAVRRCPSSSGPRARVVRPSRSVKKSAVPYALYALVPRAPRDRVQQPFHGGPGRGGGVAREQDDDLAARGTLGVDGEQVGDVLRRDPPGQQPLAQRAVSPEHPRPRAPRPVPGSPSTGVEVGLPAGRERDQGDLAQVEVQGLLEALVPVTAHRRADRGAG